MVNLDIKDNIEYLKKNILRILLLFIVLLLVSYISCEAFRSYLVKINIDPNFIIGFFTIMALLLSLIQSSYDKRFNYNMRLIDSIESKGLSVIGKLLTIKQKSEIYLIALQEHKKAIENKQIYIDSNNTLSQKNVDDGIELIVAYVETYFPEEHLKWNEILEKLSMIGTYSSRIILNYNKNINLIMEGVSFENDSLGEIDYYITESERINKEIVELTLKMRDRIVIKMNDSKGKLKDSFDFKI